jgi:hypothetical protein
MSNPTNPAPPLDPEIWGPHYWFVLMTMATNYPVNANGVTRKKYYDFIQNLPLFIPNYAIGNRFSALLDRFPVTPYLDTREAFLRWVVFIHNKVNAVLHKDEVTMTEALNAYYAHYKPREISIIEEFKYRKGLVYITLLTVSVYCAYSLYYK